MEILRGSDQFTPENYKQPQPTVLDRQIAQLDRMMCECALRADYQRQMGRTA